MKTWLLKRVIAALIVTLTSKAGAKETLDLSKAISSSQSEQHSAESASKKKLREVSRAPASAVPSQDKIVVDLRDENT